MSNTRDSAKARIGFLCNNQNDCNTCDSRIGFGSGGNHDDSNTCGNQATHYPDNGNKHIKAMGYIFVQYVITISLYVIASLATKYQFINLRLKKIACLSFWLEIASNWLENLIVNVPSILEAAWPSGLGAGLVIRKSRVQILLSATTWVCFR